MPRTLILNATLVSDERRCQGDLLIHGDTIEQIATNGKHITSPYDQVVDAEGCFLLPGIIDEHVHFRQPGMETKGTIYSESRAAAAGGVTTFFDMPNTRPATTTLKHLNEKRRLAQHDSLVNYSFFFGASAENADVLQNLDLSHTPGIKVFMGTSTGGLHVDGLETLRRIFRNAPLPIMTHCEDNTIIARNAAYITQHVSSTPNVSLHPLIRTAEACYRSTALAINLARETGARLHVAHISTAHELSLFSPSYPRITAEACVGHLLFSFDDYARLGTRIKCNPSIKTEVDRDALRRALNDGHVFTVATDHAPHELSAKEGGALKAASGMPLVQFSLLAMLDLVQNGVLTFEMLVTLMCHHPAQLFGITQRGYLREGYKADLVLVRPHQGYAVRSNDVLSLCGWSPFEGHRFGWQVVATFCNGQEVYNCHKGICAERAGQEIEFNR